MAINTHSPRYRLKSACSRPPRRRRESIPSARGRSSAAAIGDAFEMSRVQEKSDDLQRGPLSAADGGEAEGSHKNQLPEANVLSLLAALSVWFVARGSWASHHYSPSPRPLQRWNDGVLESTLRLKRAERENGNLQTRPPRWIDITDLA